MNLLGLKKIGEGQKLTLDRINKKIRQIAKTNNINLSITQSHSESKIVSLIHRNRSKVDHLIISPGVWTVNGFLLKETLELINTPFSIILTKNEEIGIFKSIIDKSRIFIDSAYIDAYKKSMNSL